MPEPEADSPATIRDRGAAGAVLLTARAAAGQAVAFAGTLVLAHQLSPEAFGIVAFGATIVVVGDFFADGVSVLRSSVRPITPRCGSSARCLGFSSEWPRFSLRPSP